MIPRAVPVLPAARSPSPRKQLIIAPTALRVAMARPGDKLLMTLQDILAGAIAPICNRLSPAKLIPSTAHPASSPWNSCSRIIDEGAETDRSRSPYSMLR